MNETAPHGELRARVIPAPIQRPPVRDVLDALRYGGGWNARTRPRYLAASRQERMRLDWQDANADNFARSLESQEAADEAIRHGGVPVVGHLWLAKVDLKGRRLDLGLAGCRVVTTAGVNFLVDSLQGLVEPEIMKFHGIGTGGSAEAVGNTALTTELTTQYSSANTRPTGSLGELAGNANVFETAATITVSAGVAITEHGIFSVATSGSGVLLDRTLFAAVNLLSGESLQATYDLTFPAGS